MNQSCPPNQPNLISLTEAARLLAVTVDTLLTWNEYNILKPTITHTGEVGYRQEQIDQFLAIRQLTPSDEAPVSISPKTTTKPFSVVPFLFISAGVATMVVGLLTQPVTIDLQPAQISSTGPDLASQVLPTPLADYTDNFAYSQTTNVASDQNTSDSVFDSDGNIKGSASNTDVLAAAIGANGMIQSNNPAKQPINPNLLLAIAGFSLLSLPIIFKKRPAYAPPNPITAQMLLSNTAGNPDEQKVLEVSQKTDGTVVLCFGGQEYKVSKPELDSESDQFIERLMGLVEPGIKEIDYDAYKDPDIRLSAPLSKLVTRLGFVGIKRDLFFPRTSKNRVLFRRYLTSRDLALMNLTPDQITGDFLTGN